MFKKDLRAKIKIDEKFRTKKWAKNRMIFLKDNSQSTKQIKQATKKKIYYYKIIDSIYKDKIKELDILCIDWKYLTP